MKNLLLRFRKKNYPPSKLVWRAYWTMSWILWIIIYIRAKLWDQSILDFWDLILFQTVMLLTISTINTYSIRNDKKKSGENSKG
ncbi:hypothetical protein EDD57_10966 [Baia soyae]|uniref:Uncharacterized protein n=1 Tax=Baia soyae TaxID=1544746 RepID=A0A4R2S0A1_9BACL|nr:hypothetical protein EDD57_10966 [Baia soyae]